MRLPTPSGLFTSQHSEPTPGTCLTISMAGRRPLLTEVQALVAPSAAPVPRRVTHGVESTRVAMILAVLQRRAGVKLHTREVYVSTVGGVRVSDPATDLATAIAVASAALECLQPSGGCARRGRPLRRAAAGAGVDRRLAEASRLGFEIALVPAGGTSGPRHAGHRSLAAGRARGMLQLRREVPPTTTRPSGRDGTVPPAMDNAVAPVGVSPGHGQPCTPTCWRGRGQQRGAS